MMKKLLVLIVVLGMALPASASLEISIHNTDGTPWDGSPLLPSENLWLDIEGVGGDTGDYYFVVVAAIGDATISGGVPVVGAPSATMVLGSLADNVLLLPGYEGVVGTVSDFTAPTPYPDGTYIDEILFHCDSEQDVLVQLIEVDSGTWSVTQNVLDSVVIPQVPEPATMLLLGIGGLFLRRKKK